MIKAVFMDYTGTLMSENSRYAIQAAKLVAENSTIPDIKTVIKIWWQLFTDLESQSYRAAFMTEDEILVKAFNDLKKNYAASVRQDEFCSLIHKFWCKSPIFEDVKMFFDKCGLPIYIITNNAENYVNIFLSDNDLKCSGIISGNMVKAYKPHREIFEKALEISGCKPHEVIHIGDSIVSDINGALAVGITPCLLDRSCTRKTEKYMVCSSLNEFLKILNNNSAV